MAEGGSFPQQPQRQPRRVSITLSYHVHQVLLNRSQEEGRSLSNLCAYLIEEELLEKSQQEWQMRWFKSQ